MKEKDDIDDLTIEPGSSAREVERPLRAVVFGTQPAQVKQMCEQLFRKKILSQSVTEEKNLLATLSAFDPDLIFLEINAVSRSPIEQIVKVVFMWTKSYARKINETLNSPTKRLWDKAKVIMYKSDSPDMAVNPAGEALQDIDEILFKCKDIGNIEYIGLYATWSFYSKLEPLLSKQ